MAEMSHRERRDSSGPEHSKYEQVYCINGSWPLGTFCANLYRQGEHLDSANLGMLPCSMEVTRDTSR